MDECVAIVVDSAVALPTDCEADGHLWKVPMQLTVDGQIFLDGQDLSIEQFYKLHATSKGQIATSAPTPGAYESVFTDLSKSHSSILCLTVSSKFSASYASALVAAKNISDGNANVNRIEVIDTQSAAGGQGLITTHMLRLAQSGADIDEVAISAREMIPKIRLLACLDSLFHVWRSGRVPKIAYLGCSLLKIKPLFEFCNGEITVVGRPRTYKRAIDQILDLMNTGMRPGPIHATVMHGDAPDVAQQLQRDIDSEFDCAELFVSQFTPVMSAHTGPGLVGVAWWRDENEMAQVSGRINS